MSNARIARSRIARHKNPCGGEDRRGKKGGREEEEKGGLVAIVGIVELAEALRRHGCGIIARDRCALDLYDGDERHLGTAIGGRFTIRGPVPITCRIHIPIRTDLRHAHDERRAEHRACETDCQPAANRCGKHHGVLLSLPVQRVHRFFGSRSDVGDIQ
jgi:hypothetical protein